jgi:hypothetical protein
MYWKFDRHQKWIHAKIDVRSFLNASRIVREIVIYPFLWIQKLHGTGVAIYLLPDQAPLLLA